MKVLVLKTKNIAGVGSFGELFYRGKKIACTVEREWLQNKSNVSCVPGGRYKLTAHSGEKYKNTFALNNELKEVTHYGSSKRTVCLFGHAANYPHQVKGCVGFGDGFMQLSEGLGVTNSDTTTKKILKFIRDNGIGFVEIVRDVDTTDW